MKSHTIYVINNGVILQQKAIGLFSCHGGMKIILLAQTM